MAKAGGPAGFYEKPVIDWRHVPEDLRQLYDRPGFLIRRCHQIVVSVFMRGCKEVGITPTQYALLYVLHCRPGVTQAEVAKILGLDRATIGSVVGRLAANGLIEKTASSADRRKHNLKLTDKGLKVCAQAQEAVKEVRDVILQPLAPEDREKFLDNLRKIMHAHGEIADAPPMGFDGT